jgi:hypothetical protein
VVEVNLSAFTNNVKNPDADDIDIILQQKCSEHEKPEGGAYVDHRYRVSATPFAADSAIANVSSVRCTGCQLDGLPDTSN